MPSDAEIEKQVQGLFKAKFWSTWASPFAGIPYKIDSNPMALTSNLYWKLIDKYKNQGMSNEDARAAAGAAVGARDRSPPPWLIQVSACA
mgnify:CR=1 FL=1